MFKRKYSNKMVELVSKTVGTNSYENLDQEEIIEAIARHGRIKMKGGLTKYLMDNKHWSPLEFIDFTFKFDTSRGIAPQFLRHRSFSFQEWSLRYDKPKGMQTIDLRLQSESNRQSSTEHIGELYMAFENEVSYTFTMNITEEQASAINQASEALQAIYRAYDQLIKAGVAKECARAVLPLATTTTLHMKGNLRFWLSFLNVRLDHHAQLEIRQIAEQIGEELSTQLPLVFSCIDWRNGMFM